MPGFLKQSLSLRDTLFRLNPWIKPQADEFARALALPTGIPGAKLAAARRAASLARIAAGASAWNAWAAAMQAPPLGPGKLVKYDDAAPSTLDQNAKDIAAFLTWASDPHMEERKHTGVAVMIYLLAFSALLYASYRIVWRNVSH